MAPDWNLTRGAAESRQFALIHRARQLMAQAVPYAGRIPGNGAEEVPWISNTTDTSPYLTSAADSAMKFGERTHPSPCASQPTFPVERQGRDEPQQPHGYEACGDLKRWISFRSSDEFEEAAIALPVELPPEAHRTVADKSNRTTWQPANTPEINA